jgi:hypothetical protein
MKINKTLGAVALALAAAAGAQAATTTTTQIPATTDEQVFITGSTAFRSQVYKGLQDLSLTQQTDDVSANNIFTFTGKPTGSTVGTSYGTLTLNFTTKSVTVYCSFDGSEEGVVACTVPTTQRLFENVETGGGYGGGGQGGFGTGGYANPILFQSAVTMAFSDVEQGSCPPSVQNPVLGEITSQDAQAAAAGSQGYGEGICVQPFLWAGNAAFGASNAVYSIPNNMDANEAANLFAGGALPLEWWTGNANDTGATAADQVALTGRNISSGTRITAQLLTPYPATSTIYQYGIGITAGNEMGTWADPSTLAANLAWGPVGGGAASKSTDAAIDGGYSSGSKVADALIYGGATPAVGYLSFADAKGLPTASGQFQGTTTPPAAKNGASEVPGVICSWNGISPVLQYSPLEYNIAAVRDGSYPIWSYEHLYLTSAGAGSYAITDFGPGLAVAVCYEVSLQTATSPITAVLESTMNVNRSPDGSSLVDTPFSPQ